MSPRLDIDVVPCKRAEVLVRAIGYNLFQTIKLHATYYLKVAVRESARDDSKFFLTLAVAFAKFLLTKNP